MRYLVTHLFVSSCVMQEKEQNLLEACDSGDLDEAQRLAASGVSVRCRDKVCCEITE